MELLSRTEQVEKVLLTATRNGFPYGDRVIHLFMAGSALHGGRVPGKHDDDFAGVFVEPESKIIGLEEYPHYVWSSAGDHQRNQHGDIDLVLYGFRKWAKLAGGGNPTALGFLFAPNLLWNKFWQPVQEQFTLFASSSHVSSFEGFARQQLERILGLRGKGKHGQRPELEEQFGYDVKAGMHVVRLLNEGIEYMNTGMITYPRPEKDLLIDIRLGKYTAVQVEAMANELFADLDRAAASSPLNPKVDWEKINQFVVNMYLDYWGRAK